MVLLEQRQRNSKTICILRVVLLIIDNYDSFTYNLVQRIGEHDLASEINRDVQIVRNDEITLEQAIELQPDQLIISPGPCTPTESGVSRTLIQHFANHIPILGVCLGHQAIADVFGMKIEQYANPMHGKTSEVFHDGRGLFIDMPNPFIATRYHSLIVNTDSISDDFELTAWTEDGACMGIRHRGNGPLLAGVQFHPESFLTTDGPQILSNFLNEGICTS